MISPDGVVFTVDKKFVIPLDGVFSNVNKNVGEFGYFFTRWRSFRCE